MLVHRSPRLVCHRGWTVRSQTDRCKIRIASEVSVWSLDGLLRGNCVADVEKGDWDCHEATVKVETIPEMSAQRHIFEIIDLYSFNRIIGLSEWRINKARHIVTLFYNDQLSQCLRMTLCTRSETTSDYVILYSVILRSNFSKLSNTFCYNLTFGYNLTFCYIFLTTFK